MRSSVEFATALTLAFAAHEASAPCMPASSDYRIPARARGGARSRNRRAGRAAARLAIARASGIEDVGRIVLRSRPDTSPAAFLLGACGAVRELPVALSIAHSADHAVAAVAPRSSRVGVDLERCGSVKTRQLRYFLTPAERRGGRRHSPTALWVLKEAAWKALGCNGGTPFTSVTLHFDARGRVSTVGRDGQMIGVRTALLRPWPGFVCAVVAEGEPR